MASKKASADRFAAKGFAAFFAGYFYGYSYYFRAEIA